MQQSLGTPTAVLAQGALFRVIEGRWSKRLREQSAAMHKFFGEIEARWINYDKMEEAGMLNSCKKYKIFDRHRTTWLNRFNELRQRHEREAETLVLQNSDLLVGLSLLYLTTGFLISQQDAVSGERKAKMKLQRKYNICGALGM